MERRGQQVDDEDSPHRGPHQNDTRSRVVAVRKLLSLGELRRDDRDMGKKEQRLRVLHHTRGTRERSEERELVEQRTIARHLQQRQIRLGLGIEQRRVRVRRTHQFSHSGCQEGSMASARGHPGLGELRRHGEAVQGGRGGQRLVLRGDARVSHVDGVEFVVQRGRRPSGDLQRRSDPEDLAGIPAREQGWNSDAERRIGVEVRVHVVGLSHEDDLRRRLVQADRPDRDRLRRRRDKNFSGAQRLRSGPAELRHDLLVGERSLAGRQLRAVESDGRGPARLGERRRHGQNLVLQRLTRKKRGLARLGERRRDGQNFVLQRLTRKKLLRRR